MELFLDLYNTIQKYESRNAFHINGEIYSYGDLATSISKIRKAIREVCQENETNIGVVANDDLDTYACILALWFEGKAYVPINPDTPEKRNANVLLQADIKTIVDSSSSYEVNANFNYIQTEELIPAETYLQPMTTSGDNLAYILFTSGTTGTPKGIPITRENITGLARAMKATGIEISEQDRCLQMADLTFDLSVVSYLIPLLNGSCIYTVPKNKIKYSYIYHLMEEEKLTFLIMVPSILQYLRNHFDEINLPKVRYCLFCGEALLLDITKEWSTCIPNSKIINFYGPTENTVFSTFYEYKRTKQNSAHNNILSVGKSMEGTLSIIVNENEEIIKDSQEGELCLAGNQLTPNYWKNAFKNKASFFNLDVEGKEHRFYKTGDLCKFNEDGDLMYLERIDFQTQIQGYRVELTEIESHVNNFIKRSHVIAFNTKDAIGNEEIGLAIESEAFDIEDLKSYLKEKMPEYMMPKNIHFLDQLPLNENGKIDRKKIQSLFANSND